MCPQLVLHPIICGVLDTNLCWSAYQTLPLCRVWPREISLSRGYKLHTPTKVHGTTVVNFVEYADALHGVTSSLRELFIQVREIWFMGRGDFCIKVPWVTHGKDLCKTCHQLLLGRNYATRVLHESFIIYNPVYIMKLRPIPVKDLCKSNKWYGTYPFILCGM